MILSFFNLFTFSSPHQNIGSDVEGGVNLVYFVHSCVLTISNKYLINFSEHMMNKQMDG